MEPVNFGCGHPRTEVNSFTDCLGYLRCRTCRREYGRKWRRKRRAAVKAARQAAAA